LQLAKGERARHVRIAWLGDSHTQPDIWTHAVRVPLQQRFGIGGPGFVHVGWNKWGYRSAGAELAIEGSWRIEPPRLLSVEPYDDAVLGLGGVRLVAPQGARATVKARASALPGAGRWELTLRFVGDGHVRVVPSTGDPVQVIASPELPGVRHVSWVTAGPGGGCSIEVVRGQAQFFGLVAESEEPGVVLDVLGLNGARAVHALGWNEAAWNEAMARRGHDLVVLAYGTNEAGIGGLSMERHRAELVALVDRVKAASPEADCWILGAMDRGGPQTSEKIERINEAQAAAAKDRGCAFWSAQAAMGGRGSMQKWLEEEPPMATSDRVHLQVRGYRRLGAMVARDLLRGYDEGADR
jgi:lysophospholipase L1-like esterase